MKQRSEDLRRVIQQEHNSYFELVAEYTYDWEIWLDPLGKYVWTNKAIERITGFTPQQAANMPDFPLQLFIEEERDKIASLLKEGLSKRTRDNDVVFTVLRKDISHVPVSISWQPMYDIKNEYLGLRISVRNLDTRLAVEDEVRSDRNKLQMLFESMEEGFAHGRVIVNDLGEPVDWIFLNVNRAFERQTGIKSEKVVGKRLTEAMPGIDKDPANWIKKFGQIALSGKKGYVEDYSPTLNKYFGVYVSSPQANEFILTFQDITERKKAENKLQEKMEELEILNKAMVGRELKMAELKTQLEKCKKNHGEEE